MGALAQPGPGHHGHLYRVIAGAQCRAAAGAVRPARHRGRPVPEVPAPRPRLSRLLGHCRGDHVHLLRQHDLRPPAPSRGRDHRRGLRRSVRRRLSRQLRRAGRASVRVRSPGAERAPGAACLFLRPGHRVRRDRDPAHHRDVLRPRGSGQGSEGGKNIKNTKTLFGKFRQDISSASKLANTRAVKIDDNTVKLLEDKFEKERLLREALKFLKDQVFGDENIKNFWQNQTTNYYIFCWAGYKVRVQDNNAQGYSHVRVPEGVGKMKDTLRI